MWAACPLHPVCLNLISPATEGEYQSDSCAACTTVFQRVEEAEIPFQQFDCLLCAKAEDGVNTGGVDVDPSPDDFVSKELPVHIV